MKKFFLALIALSTLSLVGFSSHEHGKHERESRAKFFENKEKGKGDVRGIETTIYFAMEHESEHEHWIKIEREVKFRNDKFNHKDPIINLGITNLHINGEHIPIVSQTMHVETIIDDDKAINITCIPIEEELFLRLIDTPTLSYEINARNFGKSANRLNAKESKRFREEVGHMKKEHAEKKERKHG